MMTMQDYEAVKIARAFTAKQLQIAHPHLIPVDNKSRNDSLVAAAKNIRIELSRAFPGVKFAVHSSRFSMGDSIDIKWSDGPTSKQTEAITNKYAGGHFDGMTDSYTNREEQAWNDAFGDAKFVHTSRTYSDKCLTDVIARICRYWGASTVPSVTDYRMGRIRGWEGNTDFDLRINSALSKHTYSVNREGC